MKQIGLFLSLLLAPSLAFASGYGVFTQGASGLGQANAVVAHPTGPSSLYFNPALLNDVPGRQVEVGTTAVYGMREIDLDSGGSEEAVNDWQFPSSFYYTHNGGEGIAAGIGVFFPFGLVNEWDDDYEGRYLGTSGEMFSMNINPAISVKIADQFSLAAGVDFVYVDSDLRAMVNQGAIGASIPPVLGGPILGLPDVEQKFTGDDWGYGFNLGALYKVTERVSIGAAYRSKIDIELEGDVDYSGDDPRLAQVFVDGGAKAKIDLPAQIVVGVATKITDDLIVEVGARWEDWESNDVQTLDLDNPILGQPSVSINRDWHSTWTYNIGGQYRLNDAVKINAGYLYGNNPVPDSTFEPIIPDSDAHLFTIGTDLTYGQWTVSGAFGYEYHESREKDNDLADPLGTPGTSANGDYDTDIYLVGLSVGYKF
jgi:long-chain fatty acid transport protein